MVRVISVYNFPKQDVSVVGGIIAGCAVPPHILLMARTDHSVQVLDTSNDKTGMLPTVDQPFLISHSLYGNYVACLESRESNNSIRIYVGWENTLNGPVSLRARIAGRVTPGPGGDTNQIDMMELPVDLKTNTFAVCPTSGNLAALSLSKITLWKCAWRHEGGRPDFLDFYPIINLTMSFSPSVLQIVEDIFAVGNDDLMHVFKIVKKLGCSTNESHEETKDNDAFVFPSVKAEPGRQSSLLPAPHLKVDVEGNDLEVCSFLKVQLLSFDQTIDRLNFLRIKPYYVKSYQGISENGFVSKYRKHLWGFSCFFASQQEGYLYNFDTQQLKETVSYPLTAPLIDVVMEDCIIHALTEAGLETYTLPAMIPGKVQIPEAESLCLLGLRPFVGARKLILGRNHLWLLTKAPAINDMTLYTLTIPSVSSLWHDFFTAAEPARWDAPTTFAHLVAQGQIVLRGSQILLHFESGIQGRNYVALPEKEDLGNDNLLKHSCLILADHYLLQNQLDKASDMYKESKLSPTELTSRRDVLSKENNSRISYDTISKYLLYCLHKMIRIENSNFLAHKGNPEDFYTGTVGALITSTMEYTQDVSPEEVSNLLLSLSIVQYFASDRCLSSIEKCSGPSSILAQSLIWLLRGHSKKAEQLLESIEANALNDLVMNHLNLLLDRGSLSELTTILINLHPNLVTSGLLKIIQSKMITLEETHQILFGLLPKGTAILRSVLEELILNSKCNETLIEMLAVIYLDELQSKDNSLDSLEYEEIPFNDFRPKYLDLLPPSISRRHRKCDMPDVRGDEGYDSRPCNLSSKTNLCTYQKLQGLLCGPGACAKTKIRKLIAEYPTADYVSLHVICVTNKTEALMLLLQNSPTTVVPYMKECDIALLEGRFILTQLSTILKSSPLLIYEKVGKDIVQFLAEKLPLKEFVDVLPEGYLRLAYDMHQSAHIKTLIMLTGSQISAN